MRRAAVACLMALVLVACRPAGEQPAEGRVSAPQRSAIDATDDGSRAPIVVDTPQEGEEITSPLVLSGSADVFEANVSYRVVTSTGDVLKRGFTTASCGSGCRGTFSVTIPFDVDEPTAATIEVFEESAEDGKPLHQVEIEVTLVP